MSGGDQSAKTDRDSAEGVIDGIAVAARGGGRRRRVGELWEQPLCRCSFLDLRLTLPMDGSHFNADDAVSVRSIMLMQLLSLYFVESWV